MGSRGMHLATLDQDVLASINAVLASDKTVLSLQIWYLRKKALEVRLFE